MQLECHLTWEDYLKVKWTSSVLPYAPLTYSIFHSTLSIVVSMPVSPTELFLMELTAWRGRETWKDKMFHSNGDKQRNRRRCWERECVTGDLGCDVRDGLPEDVTSQLRPVYEQKR